MKRILPLALALAVACDRPGVAPALDDNTTSAPGSIRGSVVYNGTARGDVVLFLFDSANLPPPDGTGSAPVALAQIPQATMFGAAPASATGPFTADYLFPQVPTQAAGKSYRVRAFLDTRHEFNPSFDFTQSPRAGSVTGGYGAIGADGLPHELDVPVAAGAQVNGITVALVKPVLFDPPAFTVKGGAAVQLNAGMDRPVRLSLQATNPNVPSATFALPKFSMELSRDAKGVPVSTAGDGLPDAFPMVFLRQLKALAADGTLTDVAPADALVIPCRTLPTPQLPLLLAGNAASPPVGADALDVLVQPFALTQARKPVPLQAGRYQIVVVERTGQVWTLPNSLGDATRFPAGSPYSVPSQGATVEVTAASLPGDGVVTGRISFQSTDPSIKSGNVIVQAYLADPANPPPPDGAAQPVRVQIIPRSFGLEVESPTGGFYVDYRITGLPAPAKYVVKVLADSDQNFSQVALLQTPTRGDLVGASAPVDVGHGEPLKTTDIPLVKMPAEDPPAFELDDTVGAPQLAGDAVQSARFGVVAKPLAYSLGGAASSQFTVRLMRDSLGRTVDADHDGLPDVWPRAYLVRLDPADATDLSQYRTASGSLATQIVPAAVDPTPFLAELLNAAPGTRIKVSKLSIIARPAALDVTTPSAPQRMPLGIAAGRYRVVLVNDTGETWQMPNEAGPQALDPRTVCAAGAPSCAPGTVQTQAQGRAFTVTPPNPSGPTGSITVTLDASSVPVFSQAWVFAYSAGNPPPPYGPGQPVAGDVRSSLEFNPTTHTATFTLGGLAAGSYLVSAVIDTRGDFATSPLLFGGAPGENTLVVPAVAAAIPGSAVALSAAAAAKLPMRPSFQLVDGTLNPVTADLQLYSSAAPPAVPARFKIQAANMLNGIAAGPAETTPTSFPVAYSHCNGSTAQDLNNDGLSDVYPVLRLVKLNPLDPTGLRPDIDAEANLTVISVAIDPTSFAASISCTNGVSSVAMVTVVDAVAQVAAYKQNAITGVPGTKFAAVPPGRYQLSLASSTGQVWRIPNELQPALLDPSTPSAVTTRTAAQAFTVFVAP